MTLAEAMVLLDKILPKSLNDLHSFVFQQAWEGKSYAAMADDSTYDENYIKSVGSTLWKKLSKEMNQNVTKSNVHSSLEAYARKYPHQLLYSKLSTVVLDSSSSGLIESRQDCLAQSVSIENHSEAIARLEKTLATPYQDWGEAMDVSTFLGRTDELQILQRWISVDRCRLIAVLGMGGMGKTALTVKLAEQVIGKGSSIHVAIHNPSDNSKPSDFDYVIWRSLRNAPSLKDLLADLISFLSRQQVTEGSISQLMYYLRNARCLIVLDNFETLLQGGSYAGQYLSGYGEYGELLRLVAQINHQSCVVFTSREKPAEVATCEGIDLKVRALSLMGAPEACHTLLHARGMMGSLEQKQLLCNRYGNNPLALKIAASSIEELFGGDVSEFLKEDTFVFNGIRRLLDHQFQRLSKLENAIMCWLALNREWTSVSELSKDIIPATSKVHLLEALESLTWRSLIQKQSGRYTSQPMVLEYVANDLIEKIGIELKTCNLKLFNRYVLIKSTCLVDC
jgi:hypothetical protein